MSTVISASTTLNTAYNVVPDTSGSLAFATGASPTVAMTIGSDQSVTFAGAVNTTGNQTVTGNLAVTGSLTTTGSVSAPNTFGFKNRIINGGAQVGQRGNVVFTSTNNLYGWCDRWLMSISGTTVSALGYQASGQPTKTGYAVQFGNVITTGATTITVQQRIESANCFDLNNNSVTFSGQVKQTTGSTQTLTLTINKANAVDNFSGVTQIGATTVSVPNNTWTPFAFTVAFGATDASNGIAAVMAYGSLGAQSTTQFYYGDLQLEKGSTATSFDYRPYGTELMLCQRYFNKLGGVAAADVFFAGYTNASLNFANTFTFPVTMRAAPTSTKVGTWNVLNCGQPVAYVPSTTTLSVYITATANGPLQTSSNGTSTYITNSAEL